MKAYFYELSSYGIIIATMKKLLAIAILSVLAIINAGYLTYRAYEINIWTAKAGICDINRVASCTNVLASPYSKIGGIPIPTIALVVYPIILLIAILGIYGVIQKPFHILAAMATGGIMLNGYFIYREIFDIRAYCILCLLCTAIIITIFTLSVIGIREESDKITKIRLS